MQESLTSSFYKQILISAIILLSAIGAIAALFLYAHIPTPTPKTTLSLPLKEKTIPIKSDEEVKTPQAPKAQETYLFTGPVEHIFFHPLIAYPKRAFDGDEHSKGFNDWFVTVNEFNRIIKSVYEKGYVLIDASSLYEEKNINGTVEVSRKPLYLPIGKKPLIISIDDVNYYDYMRDNGMVAKLVIDKNSKIATLSKDDKGKNVISYDNEVIPLLNKFIEDHPDFSLNGAHGIIALTGYEGILGYRTAKAYRNYKTEQEAVKPVIKALKRDGWRFASHSYFHQHMDTISLSYLKKDTDLWEKEVKSLVGPTDIYIYPFGSRTKTDDPKFSYLVSKGFRIFFGVGPHAYEEFSNGTVLGLRRHIDGIALKSQRSLNLPFFDADKIIDRTVRPK